MYLSFVLKSVALYNLKPPWYLPSHVLLIFKLYHFQQVPCPEKHEHSLKFTLVKYFGITHFKEIWEVLLLINSVPLLQKQFSLGILRLWSSVISGRTIQGAFSLWGGINGMSSWEICNKVVDSLDSSTFRGVSLMQGESVGDVTREQPSTLLLAFQALVPF